MSEPAKSWSMARVVTASSAGTAFEWYDFFIFGSLAAVISKVFFAGLDPTSAMIAALGLFAAGFAFPAQTEYQPRDPELDAAAAAAASAELASRRAASPLPLPEFDTPRRKAT